MQFSRTLVIINFDYGMVQHFTLMQILILHQTEKHIILARKNIPMAALYLFHATALRYICTISLK